MGAGEETYFQGVNQFTDMTLEEFQAMPMFGFVKPESAGPNLGTHEWNGEGLAASVDWRSKGAVTPVKNQGAAVCGLLQGKQRLQRWAHGLCLPVCRGCCSGHRVIVPIHCS